jgi:HEPN domain-containing protein
VGRLAELLTNFYLYTSGELGIIITTEGDVVKQHPFFQKDRAKNNINCCNRIMDQQEIIEFWIIEAEESQKVSQHLFDKKDYSYALFFGHLAVEKIIKAIYVKNIDLQIPRSHNLPRLAKAAGLSVPPVMQENLIRITTFNLEARYPDIKRKFREKCTPEFTKAELDKINEVFKWLKSTI